ncbi:MAG: hypothetical protein WBQ94_22450, partial [Terracidiphilus sp.]
MRLYRSFYATFVALVVLMLGQLAAMVRAQPGTHTAESRAGAQQATMSPLPNGIEVEAGDLRFRIVALREDVLRVTVARGGSFPEDASWAVLPGARHSSVSI